MDAFRGHPAKVARGLLPDALSEKPWILQAVRCCSAPLFSFRYSQEGVWGMAEKLKLYGFNNLTKALSFNIY